MLTIPASILINVDLVITTDTSLLHLAGSMDIPCIGLLTFGCDWRWTKDETSKWYPSVKLLRQSEFLNWHSVISQLDTCLKTF